MVDDDIEVEVEDKDLKVDTYRASGAGGQHVNKSDSAVRITHKPTGIVVQCQSQRSQHQNRATALRMLKARLFELELQKREEQRQAMEAGKTEIGWGPPDPFLRPAAAPDGQGPPEPESRPAIRRRCWTETWMRFWPRRWRPGWAGRGPRDA